MQRKGERIGWTFGWIGGFLWVFVMAVVWFFQGRIAEGMIGIMLFVAAVAAIVIFSPWRRPDVRYWKLLLPIYGVFLLTVFWVVYAFGALGNSGVIRYCLWVVPCLTPLFVLGGKTWNPRR